MIKFITQKRPSGQKLHCSVTYGALGRMTSRENTKVHALASATTADGVFPATAQTVAHTGFDKVSLVKQGKDSLCYAYGYDRQRILMEEHFDGAMRTKRYVGNCEFVTETYYVLKDNLGSWTAITNETGIVKQELSYDAWGNYRDPDGEFLGIPMLGLAFAAELTSNLINGIFSILILAENLTEHKIGEEKRVI